MESRGNGYIGYSMSVNAADAYDNGQRPISKWSKADILAAVEEIAPEPEPFHAQSPQAAGPDVSRRHRVPRMGRYAEPPKGNQKEIGGREHRGARLLLHRDG